MIKDTEKIDEKAAIDYQKNLEERVKTRTQQLQKAL